MPDVLASQPADERDRIAEALTHFLIAQSKALGLSLLRPSRTISSKANRCITRSAVLRVMVPGKRSSTLQERTKRK